MEWLNQNIEYWHWIVTGIGLIAVEIIAPSFFMLWLGISAVFVGTLMTFLDMSFTVQLSIWLIDSIITVFVWFKYINPMIKNKTRSGIGKEEILGETANTISYNDQTQEGKIRFFKPFKGEIEWTMRSKDHLSPGDKVRVVDVEGNKLIVEKN